MREYQLVELLAMPQRELADVPSQIIANRLADTESMLTVMIRYQELWDRLIPTDLPFLLGVHGFLQDQWDRYDETMVLWSGTNDMHLSTAFWDGDEDLWDVDSGEDDDLEDLGDDEDDELIFPASKDDELDDVVPGSANDVQDLIQQDMGRVRHISPIEANIGHFGVDLSHDDKGDDDLIPGDPRSAVSNVYPVSDNGNSSDLIDN